jgi:hypothetical protein
VAFVKRVSAIVTPVNSVTANAARQRGAPSNSRFCGVIDAGIVCVQIR